MAVPIPLSAIHTFVFVNSEAKQYRVTDNFCENESATCAVGYRKTRKPMLLVFQFCGGAL